VTLKGPRLVQSIRLEELNELLPKDTLLTEVKLCTLRML